MACYHPLTGYRSPDGRIVFNPAKGFKDLPPVTVPCGQCIGCRLEHSRQWAVRCMHEASLYKSNCFLTLTYDNEHLPWTSVADLETGEIVGKAPTLKKIHVVNFMKRLRKRFSESHIRFFQCGEYGSLYFRPHHHMLLFNFDFPDKRFAGLSHGVPLYSSSILSDLWPYGLCRIGDVTFESAAYVARYITKKVTGPSKDEHYNARQPEYITMSRRPGIARGWFDLYGKDIYNYDQLVIMRHGKPLMVRPPKYYDAIYDLLEPVKYAKIKSDRRIAGRRSNPDNEPDRLIVRERVQLARSRKLIRPLE